MPYSVKVISTALFCILITCCLTSCNKKPKVGTLKITQKNFVIEHNDQKTTISLNVNGKIKNTGPYDIKNIVITGRCKSCSEEMIAGRWFATQTVKTPDQKDTINYLVAGDEESFSFKNIAYFFRVTKGEMPETYPDGLEVYVESFETVQN